MMLRFKIKALGLFLKLVNFAYRENIWFPIFRRLILQVSKFRVFSYFETNINDFFLQEWNPLEISTVIYM